MHSIHQNSSVACGNTKGSINILPVKKKRITIHRPTTPYTFCYIPIAFLLWLATTQPGSGSFPGASHALVDQLECFLYKFLVQCRCPEDFEHSVNTIGLAALEVELFKLLLHEPVKHAFRPSAGMYYVRVIGERGVHLLVGMLHLLFARRKRLVVFKPLTHS